MTVWNSGLTNFINHPQEKKHVNYTPTKKKREKNRKKNKNTHPQKTVIFEKNYF